MYSAILLSAARPIINKDILSMKNISGLGHPYFQPPGPSHINAVLAELERYKLIERIGKWTKVYLKPRRFLKHS